MSGTTNEPQAWEGTTREKLWPKVCVIGGSVVTPNAMAGGQQVGWMGSGMIQFAVWHERGNDSISPPAAFAATSP